MTKTEQLTIKILSSEKEKIERIARSEGEPIAVVIRRIIRQGVRELEAQNSTTPIERDPAHQTAQMRVQSLDPMSAKTHKTMELSMHQIETMNLAINILTCLGTYLANPIVPITIHTLLRGAIYVLTSALGIHIATP